MKAPQTFLARAVGAALVGVGIVTIACRDADEPTAPPVFAGKLIEDPVVSSVVPDSSVVGVTLDVIVNGSGFDRGSAVTLERQGVPAASITTNATTYVTSRKLIANITITAEADTGKYDVAVTTSGGRKGVGIELFTVAYVIDELGMIGGTWSRASSVNDLGEVVGESCTQDCLGTAFYWSDAGGLEDLGTLPGYSRSGAWAVTDRGEVFGAAFCLRDDPGCGGVGREQRVRWDRVNGSWTITPVQGCTNGMRNEQGNDDFAVNNNSQCVGRTSGHLTVQTLSGGAVVGEESLPSLYPGGTESASAINDLPIVAGSASGANSTDPVIWYRRTSGSWVVLPLGFPGTDDIGRVKDVSNPDVDGRIRVSGFAATTGSRNGGYHAVRWTLEPDGLGGWRVISIEALEYAQQGGALRDAWGRAVNVSGDVVGHSGKQAVKWPFTGGVETLPTPTNDASGRATDINAQGWIVGAVWDQKSGCDRGAVWRLR